MESYNIEPFVASFPLSVSEVPPTLVCVSTVLLLIDK